MDVEKTIFKSFASLGIAISIFSAIPQIIKICKTKNSNDLSLIGMMINLVGIIFMQIYAFYFKLWEVFAPNMLSVFFVLVQIFLKYKYDIDEETYRSMTKLLKDKISESNSEKN